MEHVYTLYNDQVQAHPIATQIATITLLTLLGDVLSQLMFQRKPFSIKQSVIFFVIGLCYTGPLVVAWFAFAEWFVVADGFVGVVVKVALGEIFFTPVFVLAFMFVLGFLHWQSWGVIWENVRVKYWSVLVTRFAVYPVVQLLNFWIIPVNYRPILSSLLALFWGTFMSWKAHREESRLAKLQAETSDNDDDEDCKTLFDPEKGKGT